MPRTAPDKLKVPDALWPGLANLQVDRLQVVERAKLPRSVLRDGTPVSTLQFFSLWRAIESVSGDASIGLRIATSLASAAMPLSFLAAYHASDFRDAIRRVARFKRLCAPEDMQLVEYNSCATLVMDWPHASGAATPPALVDATMASLIELGRRGTGVRLAPLKVELARPAAARSTYEAYFGTPVSFGASADRLSFRLEDLDRPFSTYNKELLDVLVPELDRRLGQQSRSGSTADQIRWVLRRRLMAGRPDIRAVATELAMSERSLQRRLTDEGQTFQALLGETRHELALEYLSDPSVTLVEVAYMVGYEDQNSFFRAFRQWEGCTPSEWRVAQGLSA